MPIGHGDMRFVARDGAAVHLRCLRKPTGRSCDCPMTDPPRHSAPDLRCLWHHLVQRLAGWRSDWDDHIDADSAAPAWEGPSRGEIVPDGRIFEAFAVALLSGNTRWERILRIRPNLGEPFGGFDLRRYALLTDRDIEERVVPWFRERRAGARGLSAGLVRLRDTAARLSSYRAGKGSASAYLADARSASGGSPEQLAILLATSKEWKLPGFGIALAAEALRNMGIDLCKPDRHILRALGSWSLIDFVRWDRRGAFTPPQATTAELSRAMFVVRSIAEANDVRVSYATSVIWTAGAVSGARLSNGEFEAVALGCFQSGTRIAER
ncbi:hypothetical protein U1769_09440 [Sphingomonas sp. ZT3P38]|uniref:hypothetical protein n=1 Tax=Parasphingomonas zepuensis TaxID=3096161 RepID=UPI002FC9296E